MYFEKKTKTLISCTVTALLICISVFTYIKSLFSHDRLAFNDNIGDYELVLTTKNKMKAFRIHCIKEKLQKVSESFMYQKKNKKNLKNFESSIWILYKKRRSRCKIVCKSEIEAWPRGYKKISCSAQLRPKFILLNCWHFNIYEQDKLQALFIYYKPEISV